MSVSILKFDKQFERFAQTGKEHQLQISLLRQRQDATDAHQVCNLSQMNVMDESIEELENKWLSWEKGVFTVMPCYKDTAEKDKYKQNRREVIEDTAEGATAVDPGEETSQMQYFRFKLNTSWIRPKSFSTGARSNQTLFDTAEAGGDPASNRALTG